MYNLIKRYISNLTKEQLNDFAISKNINLSEEELDFTYQFVKKNWEPIIRNPKLLNVERYRNRYSEENFVKIVNLIQMYYQKYGHLL